MDPEKKHIIYTAEDILQYLSGKLSPSEMHAMEKAALDDPFLAEAMEGYAGMQEKELKEQLQFLKEAISKTPAPEVIAIKKQVSRFTTWRVAAAILLLCSVIGLTYLFTNNELSKNDSIAAINKKQDSADTVSRQSTAEDSATIASAPVIERTIITEQPASVPAYKKNPADSQYTKRSKTVVQNPQKQREEQDSTNEFLKGKSDYAVTSPAPAAANDELKQYEKSNNAANKAIGDAGLLNKRSEAVAREFTAVVVSTNGSPVPFANVQITDKQAGTYSDAKGNFSLQATDSLLKVEIKSIGYNTGNVVLRSEPAQNKIVLKENNLAVKEKALEEVVVTGFGTQRKSTIIPDTTISAAPADGWDNYEKYITNNLILSNDIIQKKIHGEVEISFVVHNDGPITNLKIDKSLCAECDTAAIQVIKDGPSWKVKNGNKASAKVKVKF